MTLLRWRDSIRRNTTGSLHRSPCGCCEDSGGYEPGADCEHFDPAYATPKQLRLDWITYPASAWFFDDCEPMYETPKILEQSIAAACVWTKYDPTPDPAGWHYFWFELVSNSRAELKIGWSAQWPPVFVSDRDFDDGDHTKPAALWTPGDLINIDFDMNGTNIAQFWPCRSEWDDPYIVRVGLLFT